MPDAARLTGVVDTPQPGTLVKAMPLVVDGQTIGPAGVAGIRVYLGGELDAMARPVVLRPDLAGGSDGHSLNAEIEPEPARGMQALRAEVIDRNGCAGSLVGISAIIEQR